MRTIFILLLLLSCGFATAKSVRVAKSDSSVNSQKDQSSLLQLTLKVIDSQYCVADQELDTLRFKARLVYENRGASPVIMYKRSQLPSRILVAQNLSDAAARRYEVNSTLTQLSSGRSKCYKGAVSSDCFVTIAPNSSFETEAIIGVFTVRDDLRDIAGAVKSGEHVLQVEVPTWHESSKLARELAIRWRRYGRLWYEPITSVPLPFTVNQKRQRTDCQ